MADKSVGELIAAQSVTPTDLFVLEQNGTAKKLTGQVLENWLVSVADGHGGIQSIEKLSTSGLVDTYRITLADTTTFDFTVTNGKSITGIAKTGTSGLVDTYKISYNDGSSQTYTVTNGAKGDKGDNAYVWIKYASQEPTESSHSMGDIPDDWIGIYSGNAPTAPTDWEEYEWFKHKGEKGDTGIPATLVSTEIVYQSSDSGTIIPSGAWSTSIPVVAQGKYLWKRTTRKFNSGEPEVSYDVNRMGMDGSGSVSSVAGVSPDSDGNVTLTAADVGALAVSGGDMEGAINMNGQPISGLNDPTEDTQAAPKSYVDKRVPLDGSEPMGGNLAMGGNRVTGLAEPEDDGDAATKGYTDTKAALPKTASGTVIALSDASSGPLQGLRIYGRTTQDGTPTPDNPVELVSVGDGGSVGVTIAGKNLYDASLYPLVDDRAISSSDGVVYPSSSGKWCATEKYIPVSKSLIGESIVKNDSATVYFYDNDKIFLRSFTTGTYPFIVPENSAYYRFDMLAENKNTAQIALESTQTEYEPYTGQTLPISTPNGLPGVPVTSGGNYTDADGQQWICDEVDFARGKYVQRINNVHIDKQGGFHKVGSYVRCQASVAKANNYFSSKAMNTHFPYSGDYTGEFEHAYVWSNLIYWFLPIDIAGTETEVNSWLSNNDFRFVYVLETPVEIALDAETLAAYAALHTNKPNTTIYNDAGAHMDVGYYTPNATMRQEDIRSYVDGKRFTVSATITTGWTGDSAPYYNTVEVPGILAADTPHITPVHANTDTVLAEKEAWGMVTYAVSGDGSITFACFEDKPATDIPIQIEVMR